jgi:hypothetical protein
MAFHDEELPEGYIALSQEEFEGIAAAAGMTLDELNDLSESPWDANDLKDPKRHREYIFDQSVLDGLGEEDLGTDIDGKPRSKDDVDFFGRPKDYSLKPDGRPRYPGGVNPNLDLPAEQQLSKQPGFRLPDAPERFRTKESSFSERIQHLKELNVADISYDNSLTAGEADDDGQMALISEEHFVDCDIVDMAVDMYGDGIPFEAAGVLQAMSKALFDSGDLDEEAGNGTFTPALLKAVRAHCQERAQEVYNGEDGILQPASDEEIRSSLKNLLKKIYHDL